MLSQVLNSPRSVLWVVCPITYLPMPAHLSRPRSCRKILLAPSAEPLTGSSATEDSGVIKHTGGYSTWESLPCRPRSPKKQQVKPGRQEHRPWEYNMHILTWYNGRSTTMLYYCQKNIIWLQLCSVAQSCLTLCDPMDCGRSFVHKIFHSRILEWVAISSSKGSS